METKMKYEIIQKTNFYVFFCTFICPDGLEKSKAFRGPKELRDWLVSINATYLNGDPIYQNNDLEIPQVPEGEHFDFTDEKKDDIFVYPFRVQNRFVSNGENSILFLEFLGVQNEN